MRVKNLFRLVCGIAVFSGSTHARDVVLRCPPVHEVQTALEAAYRLHPDERDIKVPLNSENGIVTRAEAKRETLGTLDNSPSYRSSSMNPRGRFICLYSHSQGEGQMLSFQTITELPEDAVCSYTEQGAYRSMAGIFYNADGSIKRARNMGVPPRWWEGEQIREAGINGDLTCQIPD